MSGINPLPKCRTTAPPVSQTSADNRLPWPLYGAGWRISAGGRRHGCPCAPGPEELLVRPRCGRHRFSDQGHPHGENHASTAMKDELKCPRGGADHRRTRHVQARRPLHQQG